ncbi:hypothetical protein [Micromonospora sp. NPDC023956]|uniref:hypothetical protein n=1 Tax=Micromonospora sp. NPDC023956 TaxID=3155722 RepID=UPI0033E9EBA3
MISADSEPGLGPEADGGWTLVLTHTGRTRFTAPGDPGPADGHLIGTLRWTDEPADLVERRKRITTETVGRWQELHDGLTAEPAERIHARLEHIATVAAHMAPILIYVGERVYRNLGRSSNLPGKSLSFGQPGCVLTELAATAVDRWQPEDACFVACLGALLASGPPVRVEEFNGVQLDPVELEQFLRERLAAYGAPAPERGDAPLGTWLERLAAACAAARDRSLAAGAVAYRVINGINLHKREHLFTVPLAVTDVPAGVLAFLTERTGWRPTPDSALADHVPSAVRLADDLVTGVAPAGFSSGFEEFLHAFLTVTAEAFDADVSMSRGPRSFASLRAEPADDADPLALRTRDFYCCVTPRAAFAARFDGHRAALVRCLSAYSTRMRYNTWHYLPHTLGVESSGQSKRSDWFFAPTMPDVTDWSDQHHAGHVEFGVRYAIRVPFGVDFDGRRLPGLYDLRLLRVAEPPFTVAELRSAAASALLLQQVYQAMTRYEPTVADFHNGWFGSHYG